MGCQCRELEPDGAAALLLRMFSASPADAAGVAVCGLEACGKGDGGTWGLYEDGRIYVSERLPPERARAVALHELCHHVIGRLGRDRLGRDFMRLRRTPRGDLVEELACDVAAAAALRGLDAPGAGWALLGIGLHHKHCRVRRGHLGPRCRLWVYLARPEWVARLA
jgi:hypothetical protein